LANSYLSSSFPIDKNLLLHGEIIEYLKDWIKEKERRKGERKKGALGLTENGSYILLA
jgi:hypothetical protein